jgi:hypothetical protein
LPHEILPGCPIITVDPSCRVKFHFRRVKFIFFMRSMVRSWTFISVRLFCTAEEFSPFFYCLVFLCDSFIYRIPSFYRAVFTFAALNN